MLDSFFFSNCIVLFAVLSSVSFPELFLLSLLTIQKKKRIIIIIKIKNDSYLFTFSFKNYISFVYVILISSRHTTASVKHTFDLLPIYLQLSLKNNVNGFPLIDVHQSQI